MTLAFLFSLKQWSHFRIKPTFAFWSDCIVTARKRSLLRLCFHRCLSVHGGGGCLPDCMLRYTHSPGQTPPLGRHPYPHQCMLGNGQQVSGTHTTGMHSCFQSDHNCLCHRSIDAEVQCKWALKLCPHPSVSVNAFACNLNQCITYKYQL